MQSLLMGLSDLIAQIETLISRRDLLMNLQHEASSTNGMMELERITTKLLTRLDKSYHNLLILISGISTTVDELDKSHGLLS